ncbi:MAG: hypothetical protein ACE5EE_10145 [Fidelibacterota bacterium]
MAVINCSAGYAVYMYFDAIPVSIQNKRRLPKKKYCVVVDGEVVRETDRFDYAWKKRVEACRLKHRKDEPVHTEWVLGRSGIKAGVITDI